MDGVHWSQCSIYAVARGIAEQHGVDWDQAFRYAWWGMRANEDPPASLAVVRARLDQVRHVPVVPAEVVEQFEMNLRRRLGGG